MKATKMLKEYYSATSKHSNYQILPRQLRSVLASTDIQIRTRFEAERLGYIVEKVAFAGKSVLDIGGNTGFFTFELLDAGAASVHCYEGNREHAEFVSLAARELQLADIRVTNGYFSFNGQHAERYDIALLLNVLHHTGDDYGEGIATIEGVLKDILRQLNSMCEVAETLVFQLGFNWKGDAKQGLFTGGTKAEMIEFVKKGTAGFWDVLAVGVAERCIDGIRYSNLSESNAGRDDTLGEFLNRPIFILRSTHGVL
jgi:SAM-dependent methyltransferase